MLIRGTYLLLFFCCQVFGGIKAQRVSINFHHLTVRDGLNDGIINAIVKDKYGYMWFASFGALNRFNGTGIRKYEHILGDSSSAPGGIVYTLFCSSEGRLFVGSDEGLAEFDYATEKFKRLPGFTRYSVAGINELSPDDLIIRANNKLYEYSLSKKALRVLVNTNQPRFFDQYTVFSLTRKGDQYYAGTYGGFIMYDGKRKSGVFKKVQLLNGVNANKVMVDEMGNTWISNEFLFKLIRIDAVTGEEKAMDKVMSGTESAVQQSFLDFVSDKEHLWIVTSLTGLIEYNLRTGEINYHQKNILKPGSIAENILRTIYLDDEGTIWVSMLGGIDYFHPQKNVFDIMFPFPGYETNQLARGFTEDKEGKYWFTTGVGITRYDPVTGKYKIWTNENGKAPVIYYNSSRAILADGNDVWIATGKGVNRYDISSGKMHFLAAKDSLPALFYLNINKDSKGNIWFCSNQGDGLYYQNTAGKKIYSIRRHPVLKKFAGYHFRRVYEDSKQRLWFGFDGGGFALYNPQTGSTRYWYNALGADSSFNSNLVVDITEDRNGIIWLTTFNGVRGLDPESGKQSWLSVINGLPSNVTNGILADDRNRLWISTSAGLALVDSSRNNVTVFSESYGFPTFEFPQHQAHTTRDGYFIFPSNKGYIKFRPDTFGADKKKLPFFIASFLVFDKSILPDVNLKETTKISLRPQENFFTITLEALNYSNPGQTWYAYKLDGLESEWHYTKDARAVYTSVPGGSYTFRYKASVGGENWDVPEKQISIRVKKVFYKTAWFWSCFGLFVLVVLYLIYKYRLKQQQRVFELESRAQLLEKEKTHVMYESLKQQLNPHFLFNSLTSLSGLIETNQQMAGNFLKQMSKIYRYILKSRDSETVKLKEEIGFVQTYINLQQTRFKEGLQVNIKVDEESMHKRIPPVTLQNMIENAIKHNIIDAESPLVISIYSEDGYLVVENNLQKKQVVETSNKQGLASLQSLYNYLSERPVVIEEGENQFSIRLPLV